MKLFFAFILLILSSYSIGQLTLPNSFSLFTENKGQIQDQKGQVNEEVLFQHSNRSGINTQLRNDGFSYDLFQKSNGKKASNYIIDRIDVEFIGISEQLEVIPEQQLEQVSNYYSLGVGEKSITNIRQFSAVTYKNVFPNIDVVFQSENKGGAIKYDFIIHPGADINSIKMRYKGMRESELMDGNLTLTAGEKLFMESIPMSWYRENGSQVKINFQILNSTEEYVEIGFICKDKIDMGQTLIIDPVPELVWAKYIGDSLVTTTKGVITDRFGYIYICGSTQSINNIATSGAYQTILADSISDAYISKYNTYGSLIWSTYFGGNYADVANDVYVDTSFNVFLAGTTFSTTGLADSTSFQDTLAGSSDAFLVKFNKFGQFQWATYFGGDSTDVGIRLSTDHFQNIYLGGNTSSPSGIATDSAYQTTLNGPSDAFVAKFDSSGVLLWSTYIGGMEDDFISGLAYGDSAVHICGQTFSSDFPAIGNFALNVLNGVNDGFVTRLDPDGNLIWSTYFGGEAEDAVNSIKVFNNNLYFTGTTNSESNISTIGAYQLLKAGLTDAFIGKMDNAGAIIWGTYFGGDSLDSAVDLFFELDSNLFIIGATNSLNLPIEQIEAFQEECGGMDDAFIAKFTNVGQYLWSTYYGGPNMETPEAIAVYGNTGIYVVGSTFSDSSIVPPFQQWIGNTFNSDQEGFFTKFRQGKSTAPGGVCSGGGGGGFGGGIGGSVEEPTLNIIFCPGTVQMLTVQGGDLGTDADWIWYANECGNGPTVGAGDTIYVSPTQTTTYFVRAESITNATDCAFITVFVTTITPIYILSDSTICMGSEYTLSASGIGTFNWTGPNNFNCSTSDTTFTVTDSTFQGWYILNYADTNGCVQLDSIYLSVYSSPIYTAEVQQVNCFNYNNGSILLTSPESFQLSWNVAVSDPMNLTNLAPGTYILNTTNDYNCSATDTFNIFEPPSTLLDTLIQATECVNSSGLIVLTLDPNFQPYSILWSPTGYTNDTITNLPYGMHSVSIELPNGCIENYSFLVPNMNQLNVEITDFGNISCEGLMDGFASASGIDGTPEYTYLWFPSGQTDAAIYNLDTGTYIVTVFDSEGCYAYDTVTLLSTSILGLDSIISSSLCSSPDGSIQLSVINPETLTSILWSNGMQGSLSVSNLSAGNYSVQLQDSFGCIYQYDFFIPSINDLNVVINPGDTLIDYGESMNLTALTNYSGSFSYNWSPEDYLSCTYCQSTVTNTLIEQTYMVIVDEQNGCVDTAYVTIQINKPCIELFIPTIFSPNEDKLNDTWEIIGTCIRSINSKVYNQWGEVIFESTNQNLVWDGTYKDVKVPNDQYAFVVVVEYENGLSETRNGFLRVMY
jgi:gliding motility-associated-like protein